MEGVITPAKPFTLDEEIHLLATMEKEALRLIHSDAHDFLPVLNELPFDAIVEVDVFGKPVLVHLTGIVDRAHAEVDDEGNWKDLHLHELKTGVWNKDSNLLQVGEHERGDEVLRNPRQEIQGRRSAVRRCRLLGMGDHTGGVTDKEAEANGPVLGDSASVC